MLLQQKQWYDDGNRLVDQALRIEENAKERHIQIDAQHLLSARKLYQLLFSLCFFLYPRFFLNCSLINLIDTWMV